MTPRPLLYLSTTGAVSDPPKLESAGWAVHVARNFPEAQKDIESLQYSVGLASFASTESSTLAQVQDVISVGTHMQWIALLPGAGPHRPELAQFIFRNFYDYHTIPKDDARLLVTLGHAYGMASLRSATVASKTTEEAGEFEMVGTSPQMQQVFRAIRKLASVDAPVLITGESGTGKELAALAIHERSQRGKAPFVAVNCGALPRNLIQTELFGHEKGSFTDAHSRKIGRMEAANGGTIFLDEIGDLPLDLQVNLLRFLQEKTIERVGSNRSISVDVRVIAATNVDLEKAVEAGQFRDDLFYRLNVLGLEMPPLRDREEDVEILAKFFFDRFSSAEHSKARGFSREALETLTQYAWPGNVRELINRVRRAAVMCENSLISPADLGLDRRESSRRRLLTLEQARTLADQKVISDALRRNKRNITQAAHDLGISRVTLYRLMERHHLAKPEPLAPAPVKGRPQRKPRTSGRR